MQSDSGPTRGYDTRVPFLEFHFRPAFLNHGLDRRQHQGKSKNGWFVEFFIGHVGFVVEAVVLKWMQNPKPSVDECASCAVKIADIFPEFLLLVLCNAQDLNRPILERIDIMASRCAVKRFKGMAQPHQTRRTATILIAEVAY